jgi:hypothetical protein
MEFDKLAGQAAGMIICLYLIYMLGGIIREVRDNMIMTNAHLQNLQVQVDKKCGVK